MTNLVVADQYRADKTICLEVSLTLKACENPGWSRLFEVVQKVRQVINSQRQRVAPQRRFTGKSANAPELAVPCRKTCPARANVS